MSLLVTNLTGPELVLPRLQAASRDAVVRELAEALATRGLDAAEITTGVLAREEVESTGIGRGIALPHVRVEAPTPNQVAIATLSEPLDWNASDGVPVDLVFLLVGSRKLPGRQLRVLARMSKLVGLDDFLADLRAATTPEALVEAVRNAESRHF